MAEKTDELIDLTQATSRLSELLAGIDADQLNEPTPCPVYRLGDLIEHVGGLTLAFTGAARRDVTPDGPLAASSQGPSGDASRLSPDWKEEIPRRLEELALAWKDPQAWTGMTRVGGIDLPSEVAGAVALNEIVLHGWDISRSSGQPFTVEPAHLAVCTGLMTMTEEERAGSLFGPAVTVPSDASEFAHLLGLSGRDPDWPNSTQV